MTQPASLTLTATLSNHGQHPAPPELAPGFPQELSTSTNCPDVLTKADIERLGRERPAVFKSTVAEVCFVITVVASMMMSEFFISGFNVILPVVVVDLGIDEASRVWPTAAISISTAGLLLPFSRLCDIYGARSIFLLGHAWMMIWSLICGFSINPIMLIICRAMQGVGCAAFVPAGLALLGQTYRPGPRKNLVFSVWGALACLGFYSGIFIAAVSASFLTWKWFFYIGAIIVAVVVTMGFFSIPRGTHERDPAMKMDWLGVITILPGVILINFAFIDGGHAPNGWKTPYIYVTLIIGVLLLGLAVYIEGWVAAQPLLPADIFRPKYMKRLYVILFFSYGVFGIFLFYTSFYMETVINISPILSAAWFTPLAVGGMILALTSGFVMHLIPNTVLMFISAGGFLLSVVLFALIPETAGHSLSYLYWAFVFPAMVGGTVGVDILFNVTNVYITTAMPHRLQATASGWINSLLYFAMSFWLGVSELAVSTAISYSKNGIDQAGQLKIGFWVGVAMVGVVAIFTCTIRMGQASSDLTADEKAALEAQQESS